MPNNRLIYGGAGLFAFIFLSAAFLRALKPETPTPVPTDRIEIPVAGTDAGNQYGFASGGGMGELCINSGMGEISFTNPNSKISLVAPITGQLRPVVGRPECPSSCYFYTSKLSQYGLKICTNGEVLQTGELERGAPLGEVTSVNLALFGPSSKEEGKFEPVPPAVREGSAYLSRVFGD